MTELLAGVNIMGTIINSDANSAENVMQLPRTSSLATPTTLQLQFWGTRGSIPVSGAAHLRYGGNTSCVTLTSNSGHLFIFDCGSGARNLGNYLASPNWRDTQAETETAIHGYMLLSHTHWDHIQGFPFFMPVFKSGNQFHITGWSDETNSLADIVAGQMQQHYFPVSFGTLSANLKFFAPPLTTTFELDGAKLSSCLLKHPLPTLAYRVELAGKVLVYATDHEPLTLPQPRPGVLLGDDVINPNLVALAKDADILIHDAQYSLAELVIKEGWGHSSPEVAVDTAIRAGVKRLVLYHHDPAHDDETIDAIVEIARQRAVSLGNSSLEILAAADELMLEL
jgi:ribonuclease BN (tRNA processing enzyme)